jgi:molybdenum cofactor guanylyltransferase
MPSNAPEATTAPRLYGLVLAGGRSRRMGADKGGLEYHGAPQARWAFDLLARHCDRVFVSVRDAAQAAEPAYAGLPAVVDLGPSAGPATGVVAALRLEPQRAWLVVAADMPLLDDEVVDALVAGRDPTAIATAFRHADGSLEPLCTIWEPASLPLLEAAGAHGASVSLRRVLERGAVKTLAPRDSERLGSVNTASDDAVARAYLAARRASRER